MQISKWVASVVRVEVLFCLLLLVPSVAHAQKLSSDIVLWTGAGLGLIGAFILDREVREDILEADRSFAPLAFVGNRLGRPQISLPIMGALYGLGRVSDKPRLVEGALHATAALLATGVVNGALKAGVGRGRPSHVGYDSDEFRPLSVSDNRWQSFPSGHTMVAFALATALAEEFDNPWAGRVAYGMAAVTGWSRVYDDVHWTSDVVGGVILSTVISREVIQWLHQRADAHKPAVELLVSPHYVGMKIPIR